MWNEQHDQVNPIDNRRKIMKAQKAQPFYKSINKRNSFQQPLFDDLNHSFTNSYGSPYYPMGPMQSRTRRAYLRTTIQVYPDERLNQSSNVKPPIINQPEETSKIKIPKLPKIPKEKIPKEPKIPKEKIPKEPKYPKEYIPKEPKIPKEKIPKEPKYPKEKIPKEPKYPKEKIPKEQKLLSEYQTYVQDAYSPLYTTLLSTLLILVNLACIILQILLLVRQSAYYTVHAAFWVNILS